MATALQFSADNLDLRLLRQAQVIDLIGFSASRIRQLEATGEFPRRIALGSHSVAWRASDIREWIEHRATVGMHIGKGATAKPAPTPAPTAPKLRRPTGLRRIVAKNAAKPAASKRTGAK